MLSKQFARVLFKQKDFKCVCAPYASGRKYSNQVNIVKSKIPSVNIPNIPINEYAWQNVEKWYDNTAVVCSETGRNYTYYETHQKSKALARFLRISLKLQMGDTIGVVLPNIPEYLIVVLGALEAGLRVTTVNPLYTANEIHKQLANSNCKLIFTINGLLPVVQNSLKGLPTENVGIVIIKNTQNSTVPPGTINFDEMCSGETESILEKAQTEDVAFLPYSSGTTGLPKGVEITHKNVVSNLCQYAAPDIKIHIETTGSEQDVVPLILPLYHIYGLSLVFLAMFSSGCKLITVPKFGLESFAKVLKERPTVFYVAPPLVLMMSNNPQIQYKHLESIRTMISGAAPLGSADIDRFTDKTEGRIEIIQGYGMTETSPIICVQTSKVPNGMKSGGCGFAVSNTECKIVSSDDPTFTGLGPNQSGEILVRGPQVMKGYFNNEKATKEVLLDDGWLRTGDIGHYDEDEHFFVTDRLKELIKVKGFQVAPAELEEILRSHPSIADAAVIGVPHKTLGESPKGFVVLKEGTTSISPEQIQEYVASKVASYKKLSGGVAIIDKIPKSAAGKILRKDLKTI